MYPGRKNVLLGYGRGAFYVNKFFAKTRISVDRYTTGRKMIEIFGAHASSESGWNLPQDHQRHLLNFPLLISQKIISICLTTPYEVSPLIVCSNCMFEYKYIEPTYRIDLTGSHVSQSERRELWKIEEVDHHHKFDTWRYGKKSTTYGTRKYHGYYKKPTDATILRVSRLLNQTKTHMLYGNDFVFDLEQFDAPLRRLEQMKDVRTSKMLVKDRWMPSKLEDSDVGKAIRNMVNVRNAEDLPDWIYCDP